MPDKPDAQVPEGHPVVTPSPGLVELLAEAQETWVARTRGADERHRAEPAQVLAHEAAAPGWRAFEDAFPTFYQFTNRPR